MKNGLPGVIVECNDEGCTWRIHASPLLDKVTYAIKSYEPSHTALVLPRNMMQTMHGLLKSMRVYWWMIWIYATPQWSKY